MFHWGMDLVVLGAVFVTATLSGVFGMAGGMLLLLVLLARLPVVEAMVLHGFAQLIANGARAAISARHLRIQPVILYAASGAVSVLVLHASGLVVTEGWALLCVGAIPLSEFAWRRALRGADIERPSVAVACGAIVTGLHLTAGTGGPLLDLFFLRTTWSRHAIIATKALTQCVGHTAKVAYFASLPIGGAASLPSAAQVCALAACSVAGTYAGKRILDALGDDTFRVLARRLLRAIAALAIARGLALLLGG